MTAAQTRKRRLVMPIFRALLLLAGLALSGYIVDVILRTGGRERILIWLGGAVIVHDLILWPAYTLADRVAGHVAAHTPDWGRVPSVPWINHIRVPAVVSGVLLVISFPLVLGLAPRTYASATGLGVSPFLPRYLVVVAVLFGGSALLYGIRVGRVTLARRRRP